MTRSINVSFISKQSVHLTFKDEKSIKFSVSKSLSFNWPTKCQTKSCLVRLQCSPQAVLALLQFPAVLLHWPQCYPMQARRYIFFRNFQITRSFFTSDHVIYWFTISEWIISVVLSNSLGPVYSILQNGDFEPSK